MAFIPPQAIELPISLYLSDDSRMNVTLFPLASHMREHPIDLLFGYLNGQKGRFFPIRMPDGNEMLLPLSDCYVFDLTKRAEEELLERYPKMSKNSMVRDLSSVDCYCEVNLSMKSGRSARGSIWYHNYVPENNRNILDHLNNSGRFVVVHGKKQTFFVKVEGIKKAQLLTGEAMAGDANKHPLLHKSVKSVTNLVDTTMSFAASGDPVKPQPKKLSRKFDTESELPKDNEFQQEGSSLRQNISGVFNRRNH